LLKPASSDAVWQGETEAVEPASSDAAWEVIAKARVEQESSGGLMRAQGSPGEFRRGQGRLGGPREFRGAK